MYLNPGTKVGGRYIINGILGHGGMGAVYLATHMNLGTEWAIKQMVDMFGPDPDSQSEKVITIEQFNTEAKILANLDHINLPKVIDFFEDNGSYYLVMEFLKGKTLGQIDRETSEFLPAGKVLMWAIQLCDVLYYLHNQKPHPVIFRDMKPDNVMLTEDNTIKLIDFGIAKLFNPASQTGTIIRGTGTLAFCPPEQYGTCGTDLRSDIYSLGATLYVLLTKQKCPLSIDRMINNASLPSIKRVNPQIIPLLEQCILKAMELNKENRYQTTLEMKKDLEICMEIISCLLPDDESHSSAINSPVFRKQSPAFWDIYYPHSIELDGESNIYVCDSRTIIQKFDNHGSLMNKWQIIIDGKTEYSPAIATDNKGNLYALLTEYNYVEKFDPYGRSIKKWGVKGNSDGEFFYPCGITVDREDNIYIVDTGNSRIQKFDSEGNFIFTFGSCGVEEEKLNCPRDIAIDTLGNIYIADTGNCLIKKFDSEGNFIIKWGGQGRDKEKFMHPVSLAVFPSGYIYVIDDWLDNIQKFNLWGNFISSLDKNIFIDDNFISLSGIATDSTGNIYVVNKGKHVIQKFSSHGVFITKWGNPNHSSLFTI